MKRKQIVLNLHPDDYEIIQRKLVDNNYPTLSVFLKTIFKLPTRKVGRPIKKE